MWRKDFLPSPGGALPALSAFAQSLSMPVLLFDIESTQQAPGFKGFRIIELGFVLVDNSGQIFEQCRFINPDGYSIPPKIRELTGIQNSDVKGQPNWGAWAELFIEIAADYLTVGFNSRSFDCPAIRVMNKKKGTPEPVFSRHLDLKALSGLKGTLSSIATGYGIPVPCAHRALPDTWTTAQVLDKWLAKWGRGAAMQRVASVPKLPDTKQGLLFASPAKLDPHKAQRLAILRSYKRSGRKIDPVKWAKRYKVTAEDILEDLKDIEGC
jgi:DNA polymerase III epsilon subunit-like protein